MMKYISRPETPVLYQYRPSEALPDNERSVLVKFSYTDEEGHYHKDLVEVGYKSNFGHIRNSKAVWYIQAIDDSGSDWFFHDGWIETKDIEFWQEIFWPE